jgi:site-specific recombinase XerD
MSCAATNSTEVRMTGPLAPLAAGFKSTLIDAGYRSWRWHLYLMAHLSRWLESQGLSAADLSAERAEEYLAARRAAGYNWLCSRRGLAPLLGYLAARGVLEKEDQAPGSAAEALLACFSRYLQDERAVGASTTCLYVKRARRFLARCAPDGDVSHLSPGEVTAAVLAECGAVSAGSAQYFVAALRSFLRFCYLEELIEKDLSAAALAVTGRRASRPPRAMSRGDVQALLGTCDRRRKGGRRNYAIILLLARLGLRAGEVAALRLEDIDWRAGELVVRGKGRRQDRLPLPADVGEAIAAYLRRGRPRTSEREVFISVCAPVKHLRYMAISDIVRRACQRAGVKPVGAHRLRHALAVDLVAAGASLPEIGQILRHQSVSATAVYARVDLSLLRTVAQSWPAGSPR